jgi:predicted TIM-barrel fold metal-dependent hydrolase
MQSSRRISKGNESSQMTINRRRWLTTASVGSLGGMALQSSEAAQDEPKPQPRPLDLSQFEPRSMLHVKKTTVERARYPVIDIHTHLSFSKKVENGVSLAAERQFLTSAEASLPVMDACNLRALTNLTGGFGTGLAEAIQKFDKAYPRRFYTFTEPSYDRFLEPNYPKLQAQAIADAHAAGAKGLKILKTLGLFLRENITTGKLVKVDDARFDPMWDACGQLGIPVAIHVSDPVAFFTPTDRFNERYEELNNHPDWSYYDHDFPSNAEILEARNRVFARHPNTQFIALHVGNFAEDLENVSQNLDRFPNMSVDIAARIGELGRQPRTARAFFEKYQDRILFGTDATPHAHQFPQQVYEDKLYQIYFRFLETDDEYFDYAPARVPPQGRWRIYGINLPDRVLKKVYSANAARLLRVTI